MTNTISDERLKEFVTPGHLTRGPTMQECIDMAAEILATRQREPVDAMRIALDRIAGSHPERVGYDQTDIDEVPDLSAAEAMKLAREALSKTIASRHQEPVNEPSDWERMARAQSRKLQAVLHVPGVKDALRELDWENGDPLAGWEFIRRAASIPKVEPSWFAVQSVTGSHIGMWQDEKIARRVFDEEYPDGRFIPLYAAPQPTPVVTDELRQLLDLALKELDALDAKTVPAQIRNALASLQKQESGEAFECPINQPGCTKNCGSYGCGN